MTAQPLHAATSSTKPSCVIVGKRVIDRRPVEVLPRPDLNTARLVFRLLNPGDQDAFIDALAHSRSDVRRWLPVNHEGESDEHFFHRTMMRARVQDIEGVSWRRAAFIERGEHAGRFLGMFNLIKIQRGLEWSCEANWWIDSRLSGMGYGTEGCQGVIDHALGEHPMGLGMHVVRGFICKDNPISIAVAQKCGFRPTGNHDLLDINKALVQHDEYACWAR